LQAAHVLPVSYPAHIFTGASFGRTPEATSNRMMARSSPSCSTWSIPIARLPLPFPSLKGSECALAANRGQANTYPGRGDVAQWEGVDSPSARFTQASRWSTAYRAVGPDAHGNQDEGRQPCVNLSLTKGPWHFFRIIQASKGAMRKPSTRPGGNYAERPARRHIRRCTLYFVSRSFSVAAVITRWHWMQARWMSFLSAERAISWTTRPA